MLTQLLAAGSGRTVPLIVALAAFVGPAFADTLNGRAMLDIRMALPPGLTFEAAIVDVSRADAPAPTIGRTLIEYPGPHSWSRSRFRPRGQDHPLWVTRSLPS